MFTGCAQLLPKESSIYERANSYYQNNTELLDSCVSECMRIFSQNPIGQYQLILLESGNMQLRHEGNGISTKNIKPCDSFVSLFESGLFVRIIFSYNYVEFHFNTIGNASRMLAYIPENNPIDIYCRNGWIVEGKDGNWSGTVENDDNSILISQIADMYFFIEQHY